MLSVSDIATMFNISCQQVNDLLEYGYLSVAKIDRHKQRGIRYLFADEDVCQLDVHSYLAEIKALNSRYHYPVGQKTSEFKKRLRAIDRYDSFLENIQDYPEAEVLRACFFLFHLNHYAKSFPEQSKELYILKSRVLKKMVTEQADLIKAYYLQGPDRKKIWLCDDCKENARNSGLSYISYIRQEYYCAKCEIQTVDKEYYSLIEFEIAMDEYRFCFHQPLAKAAKWMTNIDDLPHKSRHTGRYIDQMYLYGRSVTRIEEKVFPLHMVIHELNLYLQIESVEG